MQYFKTFSAVLLSTTAILTISAKADASLAELQARLEKAQKENLLLKAEKVERENLTMKAEAIEQENARLRSEANGKSASLSSTASATTAGLPKQKTATLMPPAQTQQPRVASETHILNDVTSTRRAVNAALDKIARDDPRRDMISKALPVASVEPVPATQKSWTGIYAGINAGYGGNDIYTYATSFGYGPNLATGGSGQNVPIIAGSTNATYFGGPVAGGQVGYNFEFRNHLVLGGEVDLDYTDVNSNHIVNTPSYNYNVTPSTIAVSSQGSRTGLDWIGTARVRLGYSLGQFMPYVTGGVAYGQLSSSGLASMASDFNSSSSGFYFKSGAAMVGGANYSSFNFGWVAGAGAEYFVADNWSVKGEYLYTQISGLSGQGSASQAAYIYSNSTAPINSSGPLFTNVTMSAFGIHQARVGLNYHTDWLASKPAVVAKY